MKEEFQIRTMSFKELAIMYFPDVAPKSASNRLRSWIQHAPELSAALEAAGRFPQQRLMSPRQVELVVEAFGVPHCVSC